MQKQINKKSPKKVSSGNKTVASKAIVRKKTAVSDGPFLLKLTLFALLGMLWVKISKSGSTLELPIPVGFIIGIIFTMHEHFQIDRKIEYAVLLAALLVGFIAPFGLYISM